MPGSLYQQSSAVLRRVLAGQMGCAVEDYLSHQLTIVERPADSREPHLALVTTMGTGSVVSVRDTRLAEWAREHAPAVHRNQQIFLPSFLEGMAAHARELGHEGAKSHSASGGCVLAEELVPLPLPAGYALRQLSTAEQAQLRMTNQFDNALGELDEHRRIAASRTAFAIDAPGGTVAAVAGIWDQYPGIDEIGLDVVREHRGHGLAAALTIHATKWIRDAGRWPIYTYGFTNVRSMNNALRCGYRPLWFLSAVYVPSDMH
ncbi:MAG: hypothetical protein U0837_12300 [Dehalococcoidia bacterium]